MPPYSSKIKPIYSLYQVLLELTRVNRFNSSMISEKIQKRLLKETFLTSSGERKHSFIYPTPAGATTRNFLSIHREAIPSFLKKWGRIFNVPDHIIHSISDTSNLPDESDQMLTLKDFCEITNSPKSLAFWIEKNAFSLLKNSNNSKPYFIEAKDGFMFKHVYLIKENLNDFILENQKILKFHGLPPQVISYISQNKNQPLKKEKVILSLEKELPTPIRFRMDELVTQLKKTTLFIPILRDFIVQNCLEDTFEITLDDKTKIQSHMFSYSTEFKKNKKSCYIYQKALPYFVQKYEEDLIQLGVKQSALHNILKNAGLFKQPDNHLISFHAAYLLTIPEVDYTTFKQTLLSNYDTKNIPPQSGIVTIKNTLRDPYHIYCNSLLNLLKKHASKLKLSTQSLIRAEILLKNPLKSSIPISYFLRNIGISKGKAPKFNETILKPNKNIVLFENTQNEGLVPFVPFGYYKNVAGQIFIGVYLDSTPAIIKHFKKEFIEMGVSQDHLEKLEKITTNILAPIPQKITQKRNKITSSQKHRTKE